LISIAFLAGFVLCGAWVSLRIRTFQFDFDEDDEFSFHHWLVVEKLWHHLTFRRWK